jgi:hypothetical protein
MEEGRRPAVSFCLKDAPTHSIERVGSVTVILSRHTLTNGTLHQSEQQKNKGRGISFKSCKRSLAVCTEMCHSPTQGAKYLNRRVDLAIVQLSIDIDLTFCDVSRQIRNRVRHVVVGHGQDGDLRDGSISTLYSSSSLVDGRQISVPRREQSGSFLSLFCPLWTSPPARRYTHM